MRAPLPPLVLAAALSLAAAPVILVASPAAATSAVAATPVVVSASATDTACTVTGGELRWGFKESFRSYISGSIANGAWEPIDGAGYETPEFSWSAASGDYDPDSGVGTIAFDGGVHFSGHGGLLDTTIAAPTLEMTGDGSARLLLDVTGVTMDEAMAGEDVEPTTVTQVPFVHLDLAAVPLAADDASMGGDGVPTTITAEGFESFPNYEAGTPFDPVSFRVSLDCSAQEPTPTADPAESPSATPVETAVPDAGDAETSSAPTSTVPWVWWVIGAVAVGIAAAGVIVAVVRRRSRTTKDADGSDESGSGAGSGGGGA